MARIVQTARLSTGGGVPMRRKLAIMSSSDDNNQGDSFYRLRAERIDDNKTKCIMRCGKADCDKVFQNDKVILTTYNQNDVDQHYHILCYKETYNWTRNHYPNSTKHIDNYTNLKLHEKSEIQNLLFEIQENKHQLFALDPDPYNVSSPALRNILRARDIEVYTQDNLFQAPIWNRFRALKNLQEFYQQNECKVKLKSLVWGYIRFTNNDKLNIPVVLNQVVLKYSEIKIFP